MADTLDYFYPNVITQDVRNRTKCHQELVPYLQNPKSSLYAEDIAKFIEGIASWISSSNYKVSLMGLEVTCLLVDRMGEHFRNYVMIVLAVTIDRLGDSKDQVRENAREVVVLLMKAGGPQIVLEKSVNAFTHKLWHVREEFCVCLKTALNKYGAKSFKLSPLIISLVKLLEDQSIPVRDAAIDTIVEIYRHVGEKVRTDITRKDINKQKMQLLIQRMDEMRESGNMLPEALDGGRDDVDFVKPVGVPKMSSKRTSQSTTSSTLGGRRSSKPSTAGAGGLDEDTFVALFEDVPKIHMYSVKELETHITRIKEVLSDHNNHEAWEKRCEALKQIRALIMAGAADHDVFMEHLRSLEPVLVFAAKDLRSQIVREACATFAYLSQSLGNKFDHCAETLLPTLMSLIQNSAKVMATSGKLSIIFIFKNTHAPRLIPILTQNMSSRSASVRKDSCELLDLLLNTWPTHTLERHIAVLQEAIKKGLGDADAEARVHSRKAFWGFSQHFKSQADSLYESLDSSKQKHLNQEMGGGGGGGTGGDTARRAQSAAAAAAKAKSRSRSMSTERGTAYNFTRTLSGRRQNAPKVGAGRSDSTTGTDSTDNGANNNIYSNHHQAPHFMGHTPSAGRTKTLAPGSSTIPRSSSAVDLAAAGGAAERVHAVKPIARRSIATQDATGGAGGSAAYNSLPRPRKSSGMSMRKPISNNGQPESVLSPERSRPKSKIGVSQSQPASRSTSPSSRLSYLTHREPQQQQASQGPPSSYSHRPARRSGIPRSQGASRDASRETSPSRLHGRERKLSTGSGMRVMGASRQQKGPPVLAQRVLTQGQDVEEAVADALLHGGTAHAQRGMYKKKFESYESDDAASETSSVCSERSYTAYGRTSDDIQEILSNMTSASWADRKEGLCYLQNILRNGRTLNRLELKKVTDVFTRMFNDSHGKVFAMFLETMVDLLAVHKQDLHDWLYICLTRLIHKMGSDMLGSQQVKVQRALEAVRDAFPYQHQFNILTRFIVDQTQTPNLKVKVALLTYLHGLTLLMQPGEFSNTSDTRLAVSRIITWTTEPKSVDVRKAAISSLVALFNLNTPEFSIMLQVLPKTFQDGATKILHSHLRSNGGGGVEMEPLSPRNMTSPTTPSRYKQPLNRAHLDDVDTENMNPEEIYNSIKQTSADIQNLSKMDNQFDELKKERDSVSQDSGIQGSMHDVRATSPDSKDHPHHYHHQQQQQQQQQQQHGAARRYNPHYYQEDAMNGYTKAALVAEAVYDLDNDMQNEEFGGDFGDLLSDILTELSNHNERMEERKNAMLQLIKLTREGCNEVWDEHFKTILLLLLETLGDIDDEIRALSLRVLREILRRQPDRFRDYAELTILKIVEAHKDTSREVSRAAEECAGTLALSIQPDQCLRILMPIIQTADFPVNLAAIKMQTKVIEHCSREQVIPILPELVPVLIQGYDNTESSVRKAAVFCLVALYMVMGDDLRPHLSELSGSKTKLLNLYIKRAQSSTAASASTSKTASPTASTITDIGPSN